MPQRDRVAFTLLELLVVIAIIAVLIAVLVPALGAAREQSRDVKCRTQLREYARGFQYYLSESSEVFPPADYGPTEQEIALPTWYQLIDQYWLGGLEQDLADDQRRGEAFGMARCPELRDVRENNGIAWRWQYHWESFGYGYNRFFLGWNRFGVTGMPGAVQPDFWRRLVEVRSPSECLLVGDSGTRLLLIFPGVDSVGHYLGWRAMVTHGAGVDTRHRARGGRVPSSHAGQTAYYADGTGNIGWVDGHVSARSSLQINQTVEAQRFWDPKQRVGGW